jgi:di/tricarboxylate transporter
MESENMAINDPNSPPSLSKRGPLTVDEILWLVEHADAQVGSQMRGHAQYVARFALEQIWSVKSFEKSSSKWAAVLTVMNAILIILTGVLLYLTIELARKA